MQVRPSALRVHRDHGRLTISFDTGHMPEGPSLVILREDTAAFVGRKILHVGGNSKQAIARLHQQKVLALRSWGKHFLIECAQFSVRIHFLLFGSYRINEDKPNAVPRLSLEFSKGERLNFYACSVQFIERPLDEVYDWTADVMNPLWDAAQARRKLRAAPGMLAADALLDQTIFAGVGNIIKNEVLHRIRVHPESEVGALPARKLGELVTQAREYSFDFYTWKKAFVLKKHYQVHTKTSCPRDGTPLQYRKHLGKAGRRAFFCEVCQRLYRAEDT
ncbi:formamidopyrimidine-DNA glycosylase [Xanthomonas vesicatoria ATCC 35937]|uniref:Formamidopyrimidine-DNA glycosylase n=2 Tax=Xanthomonas vesicatoria TaxID=56460 RepID=F0BAJ3_9XANT|nr:formamidopyrimidine-DNA glycosylase [Xanthomonas vesicatoria ATCC 35937]EGD10557.1 formamidopyrimidine-DNA glycosylase [Xanthomonas vesicatoria ATCC 35937]